MSSHEVLSGVSPPDTVRQRLENNNRLANPCYKPANSNDIMPKVDDTLYYANNVSQPNSLADVNGTATITRA